MTNEQIRLVRMIADGIVDTVREAGPLGAPSGPMYLAMQEQGCTLSQYQSIMGALVRAGRLVQDGHVYRIAEAGR
jgi:hypothetical protein